MVIEFTGISCAGKSTLARSVVAELKNQEFDVKYIENGGNLMMSFFSFPWFLSYLASNVSYCVSIFRYSLNNSNNIFEGLNLFRNFIKKISAFKYLRWKKLNCVILDEGTIHSVHNIFVHEGFLPDKDFLNLYLKKIILPDIIINITARKETLISRMKTRGHKRVSNNIENFIDNAFLTFKRVFNNPSINQITIHLPNDQRNTQPNIDTLVSEIKIALSAHN
jgi:deoxyadenosine/deoxycytidine kinase